MANGATAVDQLRDTLRGLKPEARSLLIAELERSLLRGNDVAGADLILRELRAVFRQTPDSAPRYGNAARVFYRPLEPFMVDDAPARKHPHRIARAALDPLWTWIRRDLLPEEAKTYSEAVNEALGADNEVKAELAANALQDHVAATIAAVIDGPDADSKEHRKLLAQIGTPHAQDDARDLMGVFKARDALAMLGDQLPGHISNLAGERLDDVKAWIDSATARDREIFPYALLLTMSRLTAPWQLIRLATKAAGSDVASRVADTPYKIAVTIVLAELERLVGELRTDLRSGRGVAVGALLKVIHDAARGLRTEIELPADSPWGRELAALRAQISDLLKSEIESMPGRVRRLLRPRPSGEIRANSMLDETEVAETEALIEFVGNCRYFAAELALNEMTQKSYSELQQYLDGGTGALLDALRHAGDNDRSFRQSQADAATRFCRKVFGPDYAAMLTKAAEVASQDRKADRKASA